MKKRFDLSAACQNRNVKDRAAALGYACMIMSNCRRSSGFQMRTLAFWIAPAIDHEQITFLFDRTSTPKGYVMWAHLAPDTEQRLLADPNFLLHPSEWYEGGKTWIIDFCFPTGAVNEAAVLLKNLMKDAGIKQVSWARRYADYSIRKVVTYKLRY
ncbi:RTX toxin acyltransferase family protein [compost metagenome]